MTLKFISVTAVAALFAFSGAVAQGYNSTNPSSTSSSQATTDHATTTSKSGTTASKSGTTASKSTTAAKTAASTPLADKLTKKELDSAMTIDKVHDADMLQTAKVEDAQGRIIGTIKTVEKTSAGMPEAVHVDVAQWLGSSGEHVVSVTAKNARYIPDKNIVLIRMSKAAVQKLPEVKS